MCILCLLHTFIDLCTYYTCHLWQDKDQVLDEVEVDQGSLVYPRTHASPTTFTAPVSATPTTTTTCTPPGHPPHT